MAKLNKTASFNETTHEGGQALPDKPENILRRAVSSCLLWEDSFYESGVDIAERIETTAKQCSPEFVSAPAIDARQRLNLRHVPLLLCCVLAEMAAGRKDRLIANTVAEVVRRADEPGELLALYWRNGRKTIPNQFKIGLDRALRRFDEYQLAKYDRYADIRSYA